MTKVCRATSMWLGMAIVLACGWPAFAQGIPTFNNAAEALVQVDFGQRTRVKSMSGFLQGLGKENPPDSRIEPLRPALWRLHYAGWRKNGMATLDKAAFDRLVGLKIPAIIGPSNIWHSQYDAFEKGRNFPFGDYAKWEELVRWVAQDAKAERYDLIWDIWNEPDSKLYWGGNRQQFFETFGRAAKVLRAELGPQVKLSGPSLAQYDPVYLAEFLDYCVRQRIPLSVLSWHELFVDANIPSVTAHLVEARQRFVNNPAYRSLGIKKIHINEIVGPGANFQAGEILGYLKALEVGGADGACKSVWVNSPENNYSQDSLHLMLTPNTMEPRAPWWAYKHYADSVATRVRSESSDVRLATFASQGGGAETPPQVLVGYFAYGESPAERNIVLRLHNVQSIRSLTRASRVRVRAQRIPDSGEQSLPELKVIAEETLPVEGGAVVIKLSGVKLHEARVVTLHAK